ncbi:hypothetical protein [Methylobacterium brachythecii]|uniref:Uncharacterized protein n=1 Tax=Methylobacterium brachythecii TaxID=1176177 RepID=A0A7W6ACR8_9HYPH|nr:hypothetical protein [Methylobacterium brachythecii]MBB3900850.1 hypothetical protein [Methylobacterium brachythecii]GLS46072.1 hypothetical protein GCM10007884_40630 [Methylobacterium brachythecii]
MVQRLVVPLAGALLCLTSFCAEAAPRTRIVKDDGAAKIVVYDSLCDEDNSLECLIAEIGCTGPGDFYATTFNLDPKQTAAVFDKAAGKGSVTVGGQSWPLHVTKVTLSDYTFNWDVTGVSLEKAREIWVAIWSANEVRLQAGPKKVALQRNDVAEDDFRAVVSACGAAQ